MTDKPQPYPEFLEDCQHECETGERRPRLNAYVETLKMDLDEPDDFIFLPNRLAILHREMVSLIGAMDELPYVKRIREEEQKGKMMIRAVFEPDEDIGFVYTIGRKGEELFADGAPRSRVNKMATLMNFRGERNLESGEIARSDDMLARICMTPEQLLPMIHDKYTCGAEPGKRIFVLCPVDETGVLLDDWSAPTHASAA